MAFLLSFDGDSPADPRLVRPPSAHLGEAVGTPAGVRLVHQSALVAHKVAQVSPRTGQALPKVVGSDLQHLSSNGVAYLEDRTEDQGQALFTIEAKKHSRGAGEHLLGH